MKGIIHELVLPPTVGPWYREESECWTLGQWLEKGNIFLGELFFAIPRSLIKQG